MDVEFLLEDAVSDPITDRYDEAILLFDETAMDLPKIVILITVHVKFVAICQPLSHRYLMIEAHYLW